MCLSVCEEVMTARCCVLMYALCKCMYVCMYVFVYGSVCGTLRVAAAGLGAIEVSADLSTVGAVGVQTADWGLPLCLCRQHRSTTTTTTRRKWRACLLNARIAVETFCSRVVPRREGVVSAVVGDCVVVWRVEEEYRMWVWLIPASLWQGLVFRSHTP